jgi:predicted nuclease of predicted toxin-antitoxin system
LRIVADENIDQQIVERLRAAGHLVSFIAEMNPGIDDEAVLASSREQAALLLTADNDFGELVFRQHMVHQGVLLIRLAGLAPDVKADLVASAIAQHEEDLTLGFAVLTSRSLRIRKPPSRVT